eukprot:TRINITY_DN3722_c0_g1_i3.p2 TRINITY_DN3722_c0_g1~~TRINITY_DN3722_c0_g1_i3.p2  ORF type:complete len:352 (-),score=118.40 TRINITY_DN3722_c0_g1_i3:242-1297(-)
MPADMLSAQAPRPRRRRRRRLAAFVMVSLSLSSLIFSTAPRLLRSPDDAAGVSAVTAFAVAPRLGPAAPLRRSRAGAPAAVAAAAGSGVGFDTAGLEELMKDPKKMAKVQEEMSQIMNDPQKKKMLEDWSAQMEGAVKALERDPEMSSFFEDVRKDGLEAMKKYGSDDRILRKFAAAAPPPPPAAQEAVAEAAAAQAAAEAPDAAAEVNSGGGELRPGDEVIVQGLAKAPELNGKPAMVVPATSEERPSLEGTGRLLVRLLDGSGDQFAVRPGNLRRRAPASASGAADAVRSEGPAGDVGQLDRLQSDPELRPVFEDLQREGIKALEKYARDEALAKKIEAALGLPGALGS